MTIDEILGTLTEREEIVVRICFGLDGEPGHSPREAGALIGVTGGRARQIEAKALRKLTRFVRELEGLDGPALAIAAAVVRLKRRMERRDYADGYRNGWDEAIQSVSDNLFDTLLAAIGRERERMERARAASFAGEAPQGSPTPPRIGPGGAPDAGEG